MIELPKIKGNVRLGAVLYADASKDDKRLYTMVKMHFSTHVHTNQYIVMGLALMKTFKFCLGDEFTKERSDAWAAVYSVILMSILPYNLSMEKLYSPEEDQIMATRNISHMYRTAGTLEALKTFKEQSNSSKHKLPLSGDSGSISEHLSLFKSSELLGSVSAGGMGEDPENDTYERLDQVYDQDLEIMEDTLPKDVSVTECFAMSSARKVE